MSNFPSVVKYFRQLTILFIILFSLIHNGIAAEQNGPIDLGWVQQQGSLNQATKELLEMNVLHQQGKISLNQLQTKAKSRLILLQNILEIDAATALRYSFSNKVSSSMDNEIAPFLEKEVYDVQGTFEAMCAYGDQHAMRYFLNSKGKRYSIRFVEVPEKLPQTGDQINLSFAVQIPNSTGLPTLVVPIRGENQGLKLMKITPRYPTTGVFKTLAVLVNFQDKPNDKPHTTEGIKATIQNEVNGFYKENSFQKTSFTVDATGYYTVPYNSTDNCNSIHTGIHASGKALVQAAGINTNNYDRIIYVFPRMANCPWVGLAWIGGGKTWGQSWINGVATLSVIGHELGHNFGLSHSHSLACVTTLTSPCSVSDYGDPADIMGNRRAAHMNAAQKESVGWLDNAGFPGITTVNTSGVYRLEPYHTNTMNVKALRVPITTASGAGAPYYYLEYRQPGGYDSVLNNAGNLTKGVLLHKEVAGGTGSNSYILDMTPGDNTFDNAAIDITKPFTDPSAPNGGVTITVNSVDAGGATVSVNFGQVTTPCARANPSITISPTTTQWVPQGGGANFTAVIKNNDGNTCGNSTFALTTGNTLGITSIFTPNSVSLAPGASATVNLPLQSAVTTSASVYAVVATATNNMAPTYKGSATASLGVQPACIRANPSVSVTPPSQSGQAGGTVNYTVNITNKDNSACTTANFNLASYLPNGFTGTFNQTKVALAPGASSSATLTVNAPAAATSNTYSIGITASNAEVTNFTASASASYVVSNPCTHVMPTITMTPAIQTLSTIAPVKYNVSIRNNDAPVCGQSIFGFAVNSNSPKLSVRMEPYNIIVMPGQTGTSVLTATGAADLPAGTYSITVTGGLNTMRGIATATYIYQPVALFNLNVLSDKTVYARGSTMYYANLYAQTTLNGDALPNIPLIAALKWPDGHAESLSTTSGTGTRWFGQDIQMSSPVGLYTFTVTANYNGQAITKALDFKVE